MTLQGEHIYLRALEPDDLSYLYTVENDESIWELGNTTTPFSKNVLKEYLKNAHLDIFEIKQLRLVICENNSDVLLGFIDLFDFEPKHRRVGVGILIASKNNMSKGFGSESLKLICKYAYEHLLIHQVYANITSDNLKSISLFEKNGFQKSGTKKDWIATANGYKDELIYQHIKKA